MKTQIAKKLKAVVSLVLAVLTVTTVFSSCSLGKTKIDIEDFVTVEFTSFNKHAKPQLTIDYDAVENLVEAEKMKRYFAKVNPQEAELYNYFGDSASLWTFIDIKFAQEYENLANGDTVVVTAVPSSEMESAGQSLKDIEKGLGVKIKDAEIKVEGLADAKEIDLFKDIEKYFSFEGVNGKGKIDISIPEDTSYQIEDFYFKRTGYNTFNVVYNNESLGNLTYDVKPDESGYAKTDFKQGDVCTIQMVNPTLTFNLEKLGYVAKAEEYTVTVPDLGSYITSKDQLTQKDMEILKKALVDHMINEGYGNPEIMATYYSKINPGEVCDEDAKDIFVAVIAADRTVVFTKRRAYLTEAYGLIKNAQGELRFETTDYRYGYDSEDSLMATYNKKYTLEKLS